MSDTQTPPCVCGHTEAEHSDWVGCITQSDQCPCYKFQPIQLGAGHALVKASERLAEGRKLRDEGMAKAGSGVPGATATDWRLKAAEAMAELAGSGETFSADQLVEKVGPPPHPNMLGPLFANAARADLINAVGFQQATRPSAHARVQRTWKGKA